MADNQRKKLSPEQIKQREEINVFIEKGLNRGISEVIAEYFPTNKGTYYDNVVKIPLRLKFVELIKEKLGVDLNDFIIQNTTLRVQSNKPVEKESSYWKQKYNEALKENEKLYDENEGLKERVAEQKKLIDRLERENKKTGTNGE